MLLWSESFRADPAGTLPTCDIELASLAGFKDLEQWQACRDAVLDGWVPVLAEDGATGVCIDRLGPPIWMQEIVTGMYKRKRGRDGAREAGNLAVKRSRVRAKMKELKYASHMIGDDNVVNELVDYFENSGLFITKDNVRTAVVKCLGYTGDVAQFPVRKGD